MLSLGEWMSEIANSEQVELVKKSLEKNLLTGSDDNGCPYYYIDIDDTEYLAKQILKDLCDSKK